MSLLVLDLHAEALRKLLDRADEVERVELRDERDRVAALAASEALVRAACRRHREARRPLLMERAEPLVRAARLAQPHVVLDERQDLRRVLHRLDRRILDPRHQSSSSAYASAKRSVIPAR